MYMQLYLVVMSLLPALNEKNLPWIDVIHPIIVHFVIAMTLIAVVFDIIGIFTKRSNLFEVSFLNLIEKTKEIGSIYLMQYGLNIIGS